MELTTKSILNGGPASTALLVFAVLVIIIALLQRYAVSQRDSREPPYVPSSIPIIGHIISLVREGADYYTKLDKRFHYGLYTLPLPKGRMYLVASPEWAQAIHRVPKTLHFNALIAPAMKSLFCMDDATMEIINYNLNGENGTRDGILLEVHDMMQATLSIGPELDNLNKSILNMIAPDFANLAKGGPEKIMLWDWIRHNFSVASITAIWGPKSPFAVHPEIEPDFWTFEAEMMKILMFPSILARKGLNARQRLFDAFVEYATLERYNDPGTSQLEKNRVKLNIEKYGLSTRMFAYGEVSLMLGAILNTIPTAFWLISWIFEDEKLLQEVRDEVDKCVTTSKTNANGRVVNATKLRTSCPLFSSAFRETMRLAGSLNSNRWVAEDTNVTNNTTGETYLLKKDSIVQILGNVIHYKELWGSDAASFNPRRFMTSGEKAKSEAGAGKVPDPAAPFRDADGRVRNSAFRSFGGGNNVCPGRHFAQTETMALASLFIAGFELENAGGSGGYEMPQYQDYKLMMSVNKPREDVQVLISRRKGYEKVDWQFEM